MLTLHLPFPPSLNRYYRTVNGRIIISKEGRAYRTDVAGVVFQDHAAKGLTGRLRVSVNIFPPDRRRRDLDNTCKALLDALTHAGVWADDEQIDELHLRRQEVIKGGCVSVRVMA